MANAKRLSLYKAPRSFDELYYATSERHDLPTDLLLWKNVHKEEREGQYLLASQLGMEASDEVLDCEVLDCNVYRTPEPTHRRRMRLSVRCSLDREWHSEDLVIIVSVVGLTPDYLKASEAAFTAAEFAFASWKSARERAARWGYELETAIGTETAASLSVLKWILDNDSSLAETLRKGRCLDVKATDHGPFFMVSVRVAHLDQIFVVYTEGGAVSRVPYLAPRK